MNHLHDDSIEALANDPSCAISVAARSHADECVQCAARVESTRRMALTTTALFGRVAPAIDVDALVARSMASVSVPVGVSRRALASGLGLSGALTLVAWLVTSPRIGQYVHEALESVRFVSVLAGAADRVVQAFVVGGWSVVALAGIAMFWVLAAGFRALTRGIARSGVAAALVVAILFSPTARALEFEGDWPSTDRKVTVAIDGQPLSIGLRRVADAARLDLIVRLPEDPPVTLRVRRVDVREVIRAMIGELPVVARRTGNLVVIEPIVVAAAPVPAVPAVPPPAAPAPDAVAAGIPAATPTSEEDEDDEDDSEDSGDGRAHDRVTFGGDAVVRAGERVRDVVTMGGDAEISGEVLGDVVTMGGDIDIHSGAVVHGDLVAMGGDTNVEEGAKVHGTRVRFSGKGSFLGGRTRRLSGNVGDRNDDDDDESALGSFAGAAARYAVLFFFGLLLLGVGSGRFSALQRTLVRMPFRSLGAGALGFLAAVVLIAVLAITLIGIPVAILGALGLFLAAYAGFVAVGAALGGALPVGVLKDHPVRQLAAGVFFFFLVSQIPVIGPLAVIFAACAGLGSVVLTRFRPRAPWEPG